MTKLKDIIHSKPVFKDPIILLPLGTPRQEFSGYFLNLKQQHVSTKHDFQIL